MNVLAVLPMYVPTSRVGAWVTTHEYLAGLARAGHAVHVVATYSRCTRYTIDGVIVHANGAEVPRPNVVISHLGDDSAGAHFARRLGVPAVRMVHGFKVDNRARLAKTPTALAVFASRALADDVGWDGPQIVAHPPVRAVDYRVNPGGLFTLANLSEAKGGRVLAEIAALMPKHSFLGVRGWGEQVEDQPANVAIIDPVEDMRDVYRRTRILLMPSDRESFGRVAVEAAVSGIPTIAHPSPGLVEAIGHSATWVDRTDINGWVTTIRRMQRLGAWQRASTRASLTVHDDPEVTIGRVVEAIEKAAA